MRVERVSLQVLCHATEDEEKVMRSVENVVGVEYMGKMKIISQTLKGYYNDPIILIRMEASDLEVASSVARNILLRLPRDEMYEAIREGLEMGRHGGKLYIRLDKQAAYRGVIRVSDKDSIRIEFEVRGDVSDLHKFLGIEGLETS